MRTTKANAGEALSLPQGFSGSPPSYCTINETGRHGYRRYCSETRCGALFDADDQPVQVWLDAAPLEFWQEVDKITADLPAGAFRPGRPLH
jgi:hypothetical protein